MVTHLEEHILKGKAEENEKSALSGSILQDENNDYSDSDSVANTDRPIAPDLDKHNFDSANPPDSMMTLLEEEAENPDSGTDSANMLTASDPEQSASAADTLNIDGGKPDSLKNFLLDDEDIGKLEYTVHTPSIYPERYAVRDKPEIAPAKATTMLSLADEPAGTPPLQPRMILAVILGLLGMAGAAAGLWTGFTQSGRIKQLEAQLSGNQDKLISIKRSMDELEAMISSRKTNAAQPSGPANRPIPAVILPNPSLPPSQ